MPKSQHFCSCCFLVKLMSFEKLGAKITKVLFRCSLNQNKYCRFSVGWDKKYPNPQVGGLKFCIISFFKQFFLKIFQVRICFSVKPWRLGFTVKPKSHHDIPLSKMSSSIELFSNTENLVTNLGVWNNSSSTSL